MNVVGTLKVIYDEQWVSNKYTKREFVLTIDEESQYPQHVTFNLSNNNCDTIIGKHVGDKVEVDFNLRGREWNGPQGVKYFNTLEAYRIYKYDAR